MTTTLSPISRPVGKTQGRIVRVAWLQQSPPPHEFAAIAFPEDDGGFSVFALNYPGVISQGDTLDEAKANIAEAFLAMLEARRNNGEQLEFSHAPTLELTDSCIRLRIKVDG
jgi:predicted RNase H-like HicB family nuclease